jgi:transposase
MTDFAAFLGIDWANDKHDLCLLDATTHTKEFFRLAHKPEVLDAFLRQLRLRYPQQPIAVGVEQARGPLLFALLKYDFLTLYPIHPTTLARYREAFSPSRAKDDPTDAAYAAELLHQHRDRLTAWTPDDATTRTIQLLVEQRRRLVNDRTRLTNRLTAVLKAYFPQALTWLPDLDTELACAFLTRWPTLTALQKSRVATIAQFFRSHHSHGAVLERRLSEIKTALPLVTDTAVIAASTLLVSALVPQLQATLQAIAAHEKEIERRCAAHPDFDIFASLPGAGKVFAARLLAACGTQRERFAEAQALACFSGVAPVIERSGQSCWTRWRYFCPKFLRQTFVEFAGQSIPFCGWAKAFYHLQRSRGKGHAAALRALAFKWIRIIWKCWQSRTAYDEARYLQQLRKTNSPLIALLDATKI